MKSKKRLGRPKGSKNKKRTLNHGVFKKKLGRPKGSKNKERTLNHYVFKKKRGRPKGSKNKPKQDLSRVKFSKFLGYCPCGGIIAARDKKTPRTYLCSNCGKKRALNTLKQEAKKDKFIDKKDWMECTEINYEKA